MDFPDASLTSGAVAAARKYTRLHIRYSLRGDMWRARRPSRNSLVSFPGRATSARMVVAKRPSQPESSQNASTASSRRLG
jgi:hypothetical protein